MYMGTKLFSNREGHKYMLLVHTFLSKLLEDVLYPNEEFSPK